MPKPGRTTTFIVAVASLMAFILFVAAQASANTDCPNWPNEDGNVIPIHREKPRFPQSAIEQGVNGHVEISAIISRDGRVVSAEVVDSMPPGVFDEAALKAYRKWRYCPLEADAPDYPNPGRVRLEFEAR